MADKVGIRVTVSDVESAIRGGPFESGFQMVIDKALERVPGPGGAKEAKRGLDAGDWMAPRLAVPNIREVSKDQGNSMDPPFSGLDALRVRQGGEGSYDFYLNNDNSFLLTELSGSNNIEKALMKYWSKYGLTLCGLGMLQQFRAVQAPNGREEGETAEPDSASTQDPVNLVNGAMPGLARVIIPLVRRLYKGPT